MLSTPLTTLTHKWLRKYFFLHLSICVIFKVNCILVNFSCITHRPSPSLSNFSINLRGWCYDFIIHLPFSNGYSTTIVIIFIRSQNITILFSLKVEFTINIVLKAFITHIVKIHGFPKSILCIFSGSRCYISHEFLLSARNWPNVLAFFRKS